MYGDINNTWFLGSDVARLIDYTEVRPGVYDVRDMTKNLDQNMICIFRDSCSALSTTIHLNNSTALSRTTYS